MKNFLVIGDTHEPFCHPLYLSFCQRIQKAFNCKEVIHIGDLVDNHSISYHEVDPDGYSPEEEIKKSLEKTKRWFKAFPKVRMCLGNHDRMVDRKGKTSGLPSRVFKPFREIWELPDEWQTEFEYEIGGVRYIHGTGFSGENAHVKAALSGRISTVMGHTHTVGAVQYMASSKDVIFGMAVGCGIDRKTYAFTYGRDFVKKPILGCGVVSYTSKGVNAQFIPMHMR